MHRSALYLLFLIALFIMPPPTYAQEAAINAPAKPAEGVWGSGGPALSGPAALQDMIARGLVRAADLDDIRQYLAARAKVEGLPDHLFSGDLGSKWYSRERTFMVLSPDFIIPRGLRDDYKFIVPPGQPEPRGPRIKARIYSYDAPRSAPPIAATCKFPNLPEGLSDRARVFAFEAENYNRQAKVEVQIDPSVTTSDLLTITVNSPGRPAIILLRSHEATIWHFNWTRGSEIAAVFINGQYRQAVSGLPEDVPVFINDLNDPESGCPSVAISPYLNDLVEFNNLSRHLFKRDIHQLIQIRKGQKEALAGEPLAENSRLESAAELDLEKFRLPPKPLSGRAALREALARGLIREINQEDIRQYTLAWVRAQGLSEALIESHLGEDPFYMNGDYVVLSPDFVIPDGLYDGYKGADYLVPAGMPEPKGPRRYFKVYSYDQLKAAPRPPIAEACKIVGLPAAPPPGAKVYALRDSLAEELDFQIKGSFQAARLMEVKVNSPSEPVFLLLRGDGPTIWHFSWTRGSQIAGVFLSGREPQIVSGLPQDVPLLVNDLEENDEECPKLDLYHGSFSSLLEDNDLARHLFQKSIDKIYTHREKNESGIVVGQALAEDNPLESAELLDLHKYRDPDTLMAGRAGLHEAVEKGLIKEASREEVQAYLIAEAKADGVPDSLIKHLDLEDPELYRCNYMVLSPDFVVPAKMAGVYWLAFYVPEGMGELKGDRQLSGDFGGRPAYRVHSYDHLKLRKKREPIQASCQFPNSPVKWPAKGRVYALAEERITGPFPRLYFGGDERRANQPKLMKITVNSPGEPVFLMLDAEASTVWHFSWTQGSRIAGLYIEGYGRQVVSGLPPDVPVLINEQKRDSKEAGPCPGFSVTTYAGSLAAANHLSRHLFHRDIDEMDAFGNADDFVVGQPLEPGSRLESAEEFDPEKFLAAAAQPSEPIEREAEILPTGPAGLEEALARGWIRRAGPADIKAYLEARARAAGLPERLIADGFSSEGYAIYRNPYVVLSSDFQIPKQLYGDQSASFIVPEGTPEPEWPGRSGDKAPLRPSKKHYLTPYEQMQGEASRIYSYADLKHIGQSSREPVNCVFPRITAELPAEAKVYALGAASGPALDFALEGSSSPARLMKVTVNSPDEPALLLLQSEAPTIWRFSRTKGSRIAGLFISGQGPQLVSGLPDDVPVLISGRGQAGSCPKIKVSPDLMDLMAVNGLSHLLFNRGIEKAYSAEGEEITVGRSPEGELSLEEAAEFDLDEFRNPATPAVGQAGLDQAVAKGLIRKAGPEDIEEYKVAKSEAEIEVRTELEKLPRNIIVKMGYGRLQNVKLPKPYVVMSPDFIIPAGLTGGEAVSFIVPAGLPDPQGPIGGCRLFRYATMVQERKKELESRTWGGGCVIYHHYPVALPKFSSLCRLPKPVTPDKIYAIGASPRQELDFQIDGSGEQARLMRLTVNDPQQSVALFLKAGRPVIWHINWTQGTRISAVIVSGGRYKQAFSGLPEDVPILLGQGDGHDLSLCPPNFELDLRSLDSIRKINGLSRHLFKRDLDDIEILDDGLSEYVIGRPLAADSRIESAEELDFKKFSDPNKPLAGEAGLEEALAIGLIRKATEADARDYLKAHNKAGGLSEKGAAEMRQREAKSAKVEGFCSRAALRNVSKKTDVWGMYHDAYVVLSPGFVIPAGLSFPKFYVPKGLSAPQQGGSGCSTVFVYDELRPIAE